MNEESARGIIRGRALRGALGERVFVPKDYNREGTLVWKPCAESFDPLCPFYEFEVTPESSGDQPIYIYVRTFDGKVFTHLTEHYGGA
jgi:hypothetical protein